MAGYDPKKAETFNKLRQQGLSEDQAWTQAGLTDNDIADYVINDSPYNNDGTKNTNRGQIGPHIIGTGTQTIPYTAAEKAESDAYNASLDDTKNVERVGYPVKADSQPSNKTPVTYTTTSTEQVSGGGSTTTTSGVATANERSTALQAQADAKSAELKQYLADNPRNPNATPEEQAARRAKIAELSSERGKLATAAEEAKTPGNPTETTVPNTTTNTSTTTYQTSSTNSDVETTEGPDPALNQTPSLENTQVQNAAPAPLPQEQIASPAPIPLVATDAPEPQEFQPREAGIAEANDVQSFEPEPVVDSGFRPQESTITGGQVVSDPQNLDPAQDPGAASPFGGGAFNDAAARNPEAIEENLQAANEASTKQKAQEQAAIQARFKQPANGDWRVRIRIAPNSKYLYRAENPGILAPLAASDGVIFPYTPSIQTTYNANYDTTDLVHSNYRGQFYKNSYVNDINITGIFTAQDTAEAEYLLAVIHFFRSVTKMFYGQDSQRGAPPPLVYLFGLGQYQFNNHPCVVKTFTYNLPADVDYVRTQPNNYGQNLLNRRTKTQNAPANTIGSVVGRLSHAVDLLGNFLKPGALPGIGSNPAGQPGVTQQAVSNTSNATYVPTKIEIQLTLLPIQTRNQVSQQFSLDGFAKGDLLRGGFW